MRCSSIFALLAAVAFSGADAFVAPSRSAFVGGTRSIASVAGSSSLSKLLLLPSVYLIDRFCEPRRRLSICELLIHFIEMNYFTVMLTLQCSSHYYVAHRHVR